MAHYPYLTEIGNQYNNEQGTAGHRVGFLDSTAGLLRSSLIQLAAAQAATQTQPFAGSVKDRARAFENAETNQAALKEAVYTAQAKVDKCKRQLQRMGARVDANNTIDWGFSHRTVVYDNSPATKGLTRVRFDHGRLFTDDGHRQPLDTRLMVTANMGPGYAIYVMSETGNIHVSSHSVGDRHHSSLLAGSNVAGAGEMKVITGDLKWISNKSGHYFPEVEHFMQTLHSIQKKGVNLGGVKVSFLFQGGPPRGAPYASVAEFLAAKQAEGVPDYEYAKLLRVLCQVPYAEFVGLAAAKGWRWAAPAEFAANKCGVVTLAGDQVPHRDVRKWLKNELGRVAGAAPLIKSGAGR